MAASSSNQREKEIFERALALESFGERLGYVQGMCVDDEALLARVQALLRAHDEAILDVQLALPEDLRSWIDEDRLARLVFDVLETLEQEGGPLWLEDHLPPRQIHLLSALVFSYLTASGAMFRTKLKNSS